jgi:hypothetical protein
MANTPRTPVRVDDRSATGTVIWEWSGLDGDDTGIPVNMLKHPDMSVQFTAGTWGSSTATLEGTLDERGNPAHSDHANAKWQAITDTTETVISFTADSTTLVQCLQGAWWVRPKTAGGTGADVKVWLKGTIRG